MITLLMIFIIIISVLLMLVVLIQSSKGGGLAGTFGGGDASMVFGVRRTTDFLIKLTTVLATIYLLFSLVTNLLINKGAETRESIIQQNTGQQTLPPPNIPNQTPQQQPDQNQPNQQPPVEPPK
ncbi:MAG: preprotein translocase subunit SecG, partial [Ignavibacteria bacterium]